MAAKKHKIFNEEIDDVAFDTGAKKLSRMMSLSDLTLDDEFSSMFPLDKEGESGVEQLAENMKNYGYDDSQPIHVWVRENNEGEIIYTPIDGHRRRLAAIKAGLKEVPVYEHHFKSRRDAVLYAWGLQIDRRNLNDSELLSAVTAFIEMGGTRKQGNLKEILAARTGLSERTVAKAMVVAKDSDSSEAVRKGKSVNEAYRQLKQKAGKKQKTSEDDISDALEDNEGNPQSVTVRSRDMSEHFTPPEEDEFDKRLIERYKNGFAAGIKKGFSEGSYQIYDKIISMLHEGKTVEEIENDDLFSDFTFSEIAPKFEITTDDEELLKAFNTQSVSTENEKEGE